MIVRIFKTNQVYIFVFIPIVILLLGLNFRTVAFTTVSDGQLPFVAELFKWFTGYPVWSFLTAIALLTHQSYQLVQICEENRLMPFSTNFPAFLLALNGVVLSWQFFLSPALIANTFLILSLRRVMQIYNQYSIDGTLFRAGIYISIASLFYMPALFLIPVLLYQLWLFRPFSWREWVIPFTGLITVYFYLFVYYFLVGQLDLLGEALVSAAVFFDGPDNTFYHYLPAIYSLILSVVALLFLPATDNRRTVRINNLYKVTFVFMLIMTMTAVLFREDISSFGILLIAPVSIVQSYFVLSVERSWLKEGLIYAFVALLVFRQVWLIN